MLNGVADQDKPYYWGSRILMVALAILILLFVKKAWGKYSNKNEMLAE
jgi:hypothetical protein